MEYCYIWLTIVWGVHSNSQLSKQAQLAKGKGSNSYKIIAP